MTLSGVMVGTNPQRLEAVKMALNAYPWAEVHHWDDQGRIIVTIEGESSEDNVERLKVLKALPHVLCAEMVVHCFEDEVQPAPEPGMAGALNFLNDEQDAVIPNHYKRLKAVGNY